MNIFNIFKRKPKSALNEKAIDLMQKMHKEGFSVITMMIHVNALCGLSLKENDIAHALGQERLSLPVINKDEETPVP